MEEPEKRRNWREARKYTPQHLEIARRALQDIQRGADVFDVLRRYPLPEGGYLGKHVLVEAYNRLVQSGEWEADASLLAHIRLKPTRTLSGVATVTVLTKPFPCPNECFFCPTDERMPKSYIPDEPGAKRAFEHDFDPYGQVHSRLQALEAVGHPTDKIELLILGGTWTAYPRDYQEWFVRRCFDAMNADEETNSGLLLEDVQQVNETARHRNVGLAIETRPDHVNPAELAWLRKLGVTKVQMGAQSLDDAILALNHRGHTVATTLRAVHLLRAAGFKVVLHWMPNLFGSTPQADREDFKQLWQGFCPDEIKIYPTQLLENAPLFKAWQSGEYQPYTTETLIDLIADVKETIPRYCRVNRVIRDIPSPYVVAGNKRTSLRMDVQAEMARRGTRCQCVRCREVKNKQVDFESLRLDDLDYYTGVSQEHFISFVTPEDKLAGFLRLSLPGAESPDVDIADLKRAAIIREVHVYGQSLSVGEEQRGAAQHIGLGSRLMEYAAEVACLRGYERLAVIAAVGTRQYYLKRGFQRGDLYLVKELPCARSGLPGA